MISLPGSSLGADSPWKDRPLSFLGLLSITSQETGGPWRDLTCLSGKGLGLLRKLAIRGVSILWQVYFWEAPWSSS